MKYTSWFSGGGLADIGARAAGFELVAANEIDQNIAEVYRRNHGDHIRVGDVLHENPRHYPDTDLFHASPVCTNASIANANGEESKLDIATAEQTAKFIRIKKPRFVTIENVAGYRSFASFKRIMNALDDCEYFYDVSIFNAADFGVPQTRRRLFVRAVRNGFVPPLPNPVQWAGWYEAVEDLIDEFPTTQFAPWQLARLPMDASSSLLINGGGRHPRAFLVGQQKFGEELQITDGQLPAKTVTANRNQKNIRAFVMSGGHKHRSADGATTKAVVRYQSDPVFTIIADMPRQPARAWLENGKVVKITSRGLARFQSVPDWYQLPSNETLACKIIGNGVPSLMYQVIAKSFIDFYGAQ